MSFQPDYGFFLFILSLIIPLLGIITSRVIIEIVIVLFKIEENTSLMAKNKEKDTNTEG